MANAPAKVTSDPFQPKCSLWIRPWSDSNIHGSDSNSAMVTIASNKPPNVRS
jgi:trans-aconitate methyltransferase